MRRTSILSAIAILFCPLSVSPQESGAASAAEAALTSRVVGVGLNVADPIRSAKFYVDVLGLKEVMRVPAQGEVQELVLSLSGTVNDTMVVLAKLDSKPLAQGREGFGRVILNVTDAKAIAKRVKDAGYQVTEYAAGPKSPVVYFATDADGYRVELYQPPAPPPTPAQK